MMLRLSIVFLALPWMLWAQSARSLVATGNEAYQSGKYDDALTAYRQAQVTSPHDALGKFNEGAALFRKEEFEEAASVFRSAAQAAKVAGNASIEAKSLFNLGNTLLKTAETSQGHDPQTALQTVRQGAAAYRQALDRDPGLTAAAENLEIARSRISSLLKQKQQQPEDQSQDDLQQQIEDQLEKQKELSQNNREEQSNPLQQSEQEQQQQAQQQEELQKKSEELSEKARQQQQPSQEQLKQAAEAQQQAAQQLAKGQLEEAEASQQKAEGHLSQALAQMQSESNSEEQQSEMPQQSSTGTQAQEGSPLQALQLTPEDILDQERSARQKRQILSGQQQNPVEKDW